MESMDALGHLPFRLWVPSGRLAGPTWKPVLLLFSFRGSSGASARDLLVDMLGFGGDGEILIGCSLQTERT
jgi:hypothetical protein